MSKRRTMKNKKRKGLPKVARFFTQILKILFVLIAIFFIVLFMIIQPSNEKDNSDTSHQPQDIHKEEFLHELTPYAEEVATSHGIRPSILVAQAALESNWGRSQLAKEANNFFGVKDAEGKEYVTKEFTQSEWIEIKASFKQYDSMYESILDYANLLKNGTSWDTDLYKQVIEANSYEEAAYALIDAGYATDPEYAEKIIHIIEYHELYTLDQL